MIEVGMTAWTALPLYTVSATQVVNPATKVKIKRIFKQGQREGSTGVLFYETVYECKCTHSNRVLRTPAEHLCLAGEQQARDVWARREATWKTPCRL